MLPPTSTLSAINATEADLQAAWARRDGPAAQSLRADLARLWRKRRAELAQATRRQRSAWDVLPCRIRRP